MNLDLEYKRREQIEALEELITDLERELRLIRACEVVYKKNEELVEWINESAYLTFEEALKDEQQEATKRMGFL